MIPYGMPMSWAGRPRKGTPMIGALAPAAMWFSDPDVCQTLWDASPSARHLTVSSGTIANKNSAPGKWGGSIPSRQFDGSPQWLLPAGSQLMGPFDNLANTLGVHAGFTLWAWVWGDPSSASGSGGLFDKTDGNAADIGWSFQKPTAGPELLIERSGTNFTVQGSVTPPLGTWYMTAATVVTSTLAVVIYHNGVPVTTATNGGSGTQGSDVSWPLSVLSDDGRGDIAADPFAGAVDHIALDTRVYGPAEIMQLYQSPFRMFKTNRFVIRGAPAASSTVPVGFFFGT